MRKLLSRFLTAALLLSCAVAARSQSANYAPGKVGFTPLYATSDSRIPQAARDLMQSKLTQVVMRNGFGSMSDRYVLSAKIIDESLETTAAAPVQFVRKISVQMLAYDMESKALVGETTVSLTGIDKSAEKALMAALRQLQPKTTRMTAFIQNASSAIVDAFNRNLGNMLKKVSFLSEQGQFDEALVSLAQIPESVDRYDEVLALAGKIAAAKAEDARLKAIAQAEAARKQHVRDSLAREQAKAQKEEVLAQEAMRIALEKEAVKAERDSRLQSWKEWLLGSFAK